MNVWPEVVSDLKLYTEKVCKLEFIQSTIRNYRFITFSSSQLLHPNGL